MSFWNKIKSWLNGSNTEKDESEANISMTTKKPKPPSQVPPQNEVQTITKLEYLFSVLFKNKDKHIATMLNSISLSSDMKTLYLIDNGRAIAYDLTADEGVLVGLLRAQLVVATAATPPAPMSVDDAPEGDGNAPRAEKYTFKAGKNSQYTLTYNEENQTLGIIGYDDFVIHLEAPDDGTLCKEQRFEMKGNKVVRLFYKKEVLEIYWEAF